MKIIALPLFVLFVVLLFMLLGNLPDWFSGNEIKLLYIGGFVSVAGVVGGMLYEKL